MALTFKDNTKEGANWVQDKSLVGKEYMQDEHFLHDMNLTKPLWGYIVNQYVNEAMDAMNSTDQFLKKDMGMFVLVGSATTALAIELSQWGYDIHHIVEDRARLENAIRDGEIRAGTFKKLEHGNFFKEKLPKGRLLVAVGILTGLGKRKGLRWLGDQVTQCDEILLCESNSRDWYKVLRDKYKISIIGKDAEKSYYTIRYR